MIRAAETLIVAAISRIRRIIVEKFEVSKTRRAGSGVYWRRDDFTGQSGARAAEQGAS